VEYPIYKRDIPAGVAQPLTKIPVMKNGTILFELLDTTDTTIDIDRGDYVYNVELSEDEPTATFDCKKGDIISVSHTFGHFTMTEASHKNVFTDICEIPIGWFDVDACPRQVSTGIRKVTAYNKLKSTYLDEKANDNLKDIFSKDYTLTMHDIKKALLGSYQIDEDRSEISAAIEPYGILENEWIKTGSCKLTQLYGIENPLNAYNAQVSSLNTSVYVRFVNKKMPYVLDETQTAAGIDAKHGDLIGLEQNIVEYLKNLIDGAHLNKSWETIRDYICSHNGFQHIIGVNITTMTTKYYSTVQWEYEEEHGITHTVDGTIADVQYKLISGADANTNIYLYMPSHVEFSTSNEEVSGFAWYYTEGNYTYNDTASTTAQAVYPACKYSDGTDITGKAGIGFQPRTENVMLMYEYTDLPPADLITCKISELPELTLRELTSAVYETVCQFGRLDRTTDLFAGVELNKAYLAPQDTLYPANDSYPSGQGERTLKSMYSNLWTDEGGVESFRYLIITYKGLNGSGEETEYRLQRTINEHGTRNYNMSSNWLFKNLIWTAEQVAEYAEAMVPKMQGVTWFPFEMWCAGLPYIETGDKLEIVVGDEVHPSYVLQRTLKGIQNLQDTYINGEVDVF
jgi:hypothetical protein